MKKTTKRALLLSALSLLLCVSMLVGSTFAWFTDSVTSAGNKIQSGTLKIDLELYDKDTKTWNSIKETKDPIFNYDKWEPGYTAVQLLKIENEGNLALKWYAKFVSATKLSKLADVIDVYVCPSATELTYPTSRELTGYTKVGTVAEFVNTIESTTYGNLTPAGETGSVAYLGIALKMQETADNDYQNLDLGGVFDIQILATQYTYEKDSFDDQYDKDAGYAVADGVYVQEDGSLVAVSQEALSEVAKLATADEELTSVIYNDEEVPVVRSTAAMNTALAAGEDVVILTEGTYTVGAAAGKEVVIAGTENTKIDVTSGLTYINGAQVTFEGVTIQSDPEGAGYTNGLADAKNTVFNNCVINGTLGLDYTCEFNGCEFNISGDYYNLWTWGAGTVSFTDCTFNCDGKALLVYANILDNGTSHQTVNITGCTFNDNGDDTITGKAAIEITDTYPANNISYDVIINNTTVNGFSVTTQNATTFGGTDLGTNVWGNKNLLTTADLNVVINGVDVH